MSINNLSAAGASSVKQAQVQQQVATAVLGKVNEAANQQAEAALALLDSATQPASDATGKNGRLLDVVA